MHFGKILAKIAKSQQNLMQCRDSCVYEVASIVNGEQKRTEGETCIGKTPSYGLFFWLLSTYMNVVFCTCSRCCDCARISRWKAACVNWD